MSSNDDFMQDEDESKTLTRRRLLGGAAAAGVLGAGVMASNSLRNGSQEAPSANNTTPSNSSPQPEFAQEENPSENSSNETYGGDSNGSGDGTESQQAQNLPEPSSYTVENPGQYGWNESELLDETGFCHPGTGDRSYLGAVDAREVEAVLDDGHFEGEDPNGALNDGEFIGGLDDLDSVEGTYAVDVDVRSGEEDQMYVQLVGAQNGGLYTNRQGAYQLSELEWEEEWNECS